MNSYLYLSFYCLFKKKEVDGVGVGKSWGRGEMMKRVEGKEMRIKVKRLKRMILFSLIRKEYILREILLKMKYLYWRENLIYF